MFQMHWYRLKVQPGLSTTNNYCKVDSYFTYCNKLLAHRGIADNSCLCCCCYEKIRIPLIRAQFESVESHFVTIELNYLPKYCINCGIQVVNQQSLRKCNLCINKFLQFKFNSEELALSLDDYKSSEVLLIKGRYY